MSAEKSLIPFQKQCPVCLISYPELFHISDCHHMFCEACSISFIDSQADNFSSTKCLQEGCNKPLDQKKQIYKKLPEKTKLKIKKHDMFLFLQKNPHFKQCSDQNCLGYFNKKSHQPKCNTCNTQHCNKCYKKAHPGECTVQTDRQMIGNLNYKKCPQCDVWIEKAQGCDYIDCTCGCKFCYRCGNRFDRDPCRYQNVWKRNTEIRKVLKAIKMKKPLTVVFAPLALFALACEVQGNKKIALIILMIIGYPVMNVVFLLAMSLMVLLYPCFRNTYHHGLYDPLDSGLSTVSYLYMSVIEAIWSF